MVQRVSIKGRMGRYSLIFIIVLFVLAGTTQLVKAQEEYPGFGVLIDWNFYREIQKNQDSIKTTQQLAKFFYRNPQMFWLSFGLGREEVDADYSSQKNIEIDDALCFHASGAYYLAPNLELGVPADFSISAEYSRSLHDMEKDTLTHQRIIGTLNLEWDALPAKPYIRIGALQSIFDSPRIDENKASALFIGGVQFFLTQQFTIRGEFNISKDIGFSGGLGYFF